MPEERMVLMIALILKIKLKQSLIKNASLKGYLNTSSTGQHQTHATTPITSEIVTTPNTVDTATPAVTSSSATS